MKRIAMCIVAALFAALQIYAIPVFNRRVTLVQPDGSEVTAIIDGDEFSHTLKDLQGHNLVQDADGYYCYAGFNPDGTRYSSGYRVGVLAPQNVLSASMNPSQAVRRNPMRVLANQATMRRAGVMGRIRQAQSLSTKVVDADPARRHCMILLVEFQDKKMTYTRDDFLRMITEEGYSFGSATGSIRDYFNDQFRGDFQFSFDVSEIITLDRDCAYYFGNDSKGSDKNAAEAVEEACVKAASMGVDFSVCDDDGDGEVDNVFLFTAGKDEAEGGGEDCVWSHMYYLEYSSYKGLTLDGKVINNYAISTELRNAGNGEWTFTSIGAFCHEYSHALGLMDLYDTDGEGSGGRGNGLWYVTGLMDGGSYNNGGNTPPHYSAVDYDLTGVGSPETLQPGSYTLEPVSENRRYLKMETGTEGEYYLLECRSNEGWDRYIGGHGLLIYHIDRSNQAAGRSDWAGSTVSAKWRWEYNEVNNRPERQCAMLVSATDGIKAFTSDGYLTSNVSRAFFPSSSNDSFSPLTSPAFVFWDGTESPLAITDIERDGNNVKFNVVRYNASELPSVVLDKTEVFQDAAIVQWSADNPEYDGPSYISYGRSSGEPKEREVQPYEKGKYAAVLDSLSQMTAYSASIYFKSGRLTGEEVDVNFTTKRSYTDGAPYIYLDSAERNSDGSFPEGAMLPLRVYNAVGNKGVEWYLGGVKVSVDGSGYYKLTSSGRLRAVVTESDGSEDIIVKEITVR